MKIFQKIHLFIVLIQHVCVEVIQNTVYKVFMVLYSVILLYTEHTMYIFLMIVTYSTSCCHFDQHGDPWNVCMCVCVCVHMHLYVHM